MTFQVRKALNNEKGMALIIVLLVLTVLSVLGMGLLGLSLNNMKMSNYDREFESTYYIAEAGASSALIEAKDTVQRVKMEVAGMAIERQREEFFNRLKSSIPSQFNLSNFERINGEQPIAKIEVKQVMGTVNQYEVTSIGTIGNKTRTVKQQFTANWEPQTSSGTGGSGGSNIPGVPNDIAVYTNTTIDLSGGASIRGDAGTQSSAAKSIKLDGGASITGSVYVPNGAEQTAVDVPHYITAPPTIAFDSPIGLNIPEFPAFPNYPLAQNKQIQKDSYNKYDVIQNGDLRIDSWISNGYTLELSNNVSFNEIILDQNNSLSIDTGFSDKAIVVDHLNVQNGHIYIIGSGKLTIYVRNKMTMGSGSTINGNTKNVQKLVVYLEGKSLPTAVSLGGQQKIYGSLYARNANIGITGGGGFQGHIFTGGSSVKVTGGGSATSSLIYAPLAAFEMLGGGNVTGTVVSKTFTGKGGATVIYKDVDFSTVPFSFSQNEDTPIEGTGSLISKEPVREFK